MKLLFVHDHPFFKKDGKVYSGGAFPASLWSNYLIKFDKINVFGRYSESCSSKNVLSSSDGNVCFYLTRNYISLKILVKNYFKLNTEISDLVDDANVVLVRLPSLLGIIAAFIAFKKNKKVWVEVVGNANEALNSHGSLLGRIGAPILDKLMKMAVRKADYVSYVTSFKLQSDYPSSNYAITASISNVILTRVIEENEVDTKRFTCKKLKVGLIGGFNVKYKGQDVLLKAVNLLPEEVKKNIELYFIGIGNSKWLIELSSRLNLRSNIKFIDSKESGDPILSILQDMSLYIQPSLTEGMPRALLEAMSMGCPVMGSRVGGIPDVVSGNLLHYKGDYKTIARQLKQVYMKRQILIDESLRSLKVVEPYLKPNLDNKRKEFYAKMNESLLNP